MTTAVSGKAVTVTAAVLTAVTASSCASLLSSSPVLAEIPVCLSASWKNYML